LRRAKCVRVSSIYVSLQWLGSPIANRSGVRKTPVFSHRRTKSMKTLRNFLIALPLVTALMFAQSSQSTQSEANRSTGQADMGARTYTGTIVDANCSQASAL